LRLTDDGCVRQDPAAWMSAWSMLPWFTQPVSTAELHVGSEGYFASLHQIAV
jgi:hypothetical protein